MKQLSIFLLTFLGLQAYAASPFCPEVVACESDFVCTHNQGEDSNYTNKGYGSFPAKIGFYRYSYSAAFVTFEDIWEYAHCYYEHTEDSNKTIHFTSKRHLSDFKPRFVEKWGRVEGRTYTHECDKDREACAIEFN